MKKSGCPVCAGKKVLEGFNDLASQYPLLAEEWDVVANEKSAMNIYIGSTKPEYWICSKGHHWQASVQQRVRTGSGCPYCAGQRAIPGETDVKTIDSQLIEKWDYEKNVGISPEMFLPQSKIEVWWKCKRGHSWKASIRKRYKQKVRYCPVCRD